MIATALARNPESAFTHANQGWTLLHQGDHRRAFEHFREALRLDPEIDWARQGIVEAMKARNPLYRPLLGYFLWMSRLSDKAQWAVIIAIYMGPKILNAVAKANPALVPWVAPLVAVILLFVVMTWVADPLFNLMLRLDKFGRLALSREQVVASNWIGACLIGVLLGFLAYAITRNPAGHACAIASGVLIVPTAAIFHCSERLAAVRHGTLHGETAAVAVFGVVLAAVTYRNGLDSSLFTGPAAVTTAIVIVGAALSTWLALPLSRG